MLRGSFATIKTVDNKDIQVCMYLINGMLELGEFASYVKGLFYFTIKKMYTKQLHILNKSQREELFLIIEKCFCIFFSATFIYSIFFALPMYWFIIPFIFIKLIII